MHMSELITRASFEQSWVTDPCPQQPTQTCQVVLTAPCGQCDGRALPSEAELERDDSLISRRPVPACVSARPLCLGCTRHGAGTHVLGTEECECGLKGTGGLERKVTRHNRATTHGTQIAVKNRRQATRYRVQESCYHHQSKNPIHLLQRNWFWTITCKPLKTDLLPKMNKSLMDLEWHERE